MRVLNRVQELPEVGFHLLGGSGGAVEQFACVVLVFLRRPQALDGQLGAKPGMNVVAAVDQYDLAGDTDVAEIRHAVPDHGWNAAGPVAQRQLQKLPSITTRPGLGLPHQEGLRDVTSVRKVPHLHTLAKIE